MWRPLPRSRSGATVFEDRNAGEGRVILPCTYIPRHMPPFLLWQDPSHTKGLLRQLDFHFPGAIRAVADGTLYSREDTTVVQATHTVSALAAYPIALF